MKLNCDMGESYGSWQKGNDAVVMPWVDMANIACGFHASDPDIMAKTVELAVVHGVEIGAHPGYDDKLGFGRRMIQHTAEEITRLVAYQVGALRGICNLYDTDISYVKPHGALYNDMMASPVIFEAVVRAVSMLPAKLALMVLSQQDNRKYIQCAESYGVPLLFEAFADRAYGNNGYLVTRGEPGAVYHDEQQIQQQVKRLVTGKVTTRKGQLLTLQVDSICVHGDNPAAITMIQRLHQMLNP